MEADVRIDKFLWAIRIFKTRSIASEAIDGGKVKMEGSSVKNSKKVKLGEVYTIRKEKEFFEIEVLQIIDKRVAASIAQSCYKLLNHNIDAMTKKTSAFFSPNITRERGKGRPTKRERRDIDAFADEDKD